MILGIVVPCYNEEEVLAETASRLSTFLSGVIAEGLVDAASKVWFVDDGSKDSTWSLIEKLSSANRLLGGIKLSRNRGHQNALLAGLFTAEGDVLISIDADLQDDIQVMKNMLLDHQRGIDVVYGVRKKRDSDTWFKRVTAEGFYKFIGVMGVESVFNHADYRLMSRRALEALKEFREVNLFLRGIVPLIGFKSSIVYYDRVERFAGESKYPLSKMLALALDAVTSFSSVPLRMITFIGFGVFAATLIITAWTLWIRFIADTAVPGWASTVLPMYLLGGIQIFCIGVIGEYLGKIYREVKSRPRYIIERIVG